MADFDIEDKLTEDLEYIKTYMTVDIHFQFYLKEIFEKEQLYCITYNSDNKVVQHDRGLPQYICYLHEHIEKKKFLWITLKTIKHHQYVIIAEMIWDNKNENKLAFRIDGHNAYNRMMKIVKNWAVENEIFVEFSIRTPDDVQFHCERLYKKYFWQKEYKEV